MHIGETGGGEINRAFPMLNSAIDEKYEMERVWNTGGKNYFVLHERIHNTQRMLLMYTVSLDHCYTEFGITVTVPKKTLCRRY